MAKTRSKAAAAAEAEGKIEIQFHGEPHHKLVTESGQEIYGGKSAFVDADEAETLLSAPWANVTLADTKAPQWPKSHAELDALAEKLDVKFPTGGAGGGMPVLKVGDKIALLEQAGFSPADASGDSEGITDDNKEE